MKTKNENFVFEMIKKTLKNTTNILKKNDRLIIHATIKNDIIKFICVQKNKKKILNIFV